MGKPTSKTEVLMTLSKEISKQHTTFDASNRPSKVYLAKSDAEDGEPCLVKEYIYHGSTNYVKGRKEGYSIWDSTFDTDSGTETIFLTDDLSNKLIDDLGEFLVEL
jgi:hypothetical protein